MQMLVLQNIVVRLWWTILICIMRCPIVRIEPGYREKLGSLLRCRAGAAKLPSPRSSIHRLKQGIGSQL